jgi:hypothetical protein
MIAGTNFSLYHGWNAAGQHVFSWLAQKNLTSASADYSPLLKYIWKKGLLSGSLWLGQLEFGTEILHAADETRFEANNMTLRIVRQGDADDVTSTSTSAVSSATQKPSGSSSLPASGSASTTATAKSSADRILTSAWMLFALIATICALS